MGQQTEQERTAIAEYLRNNESQVQRDAETVARGALNLTLLALVTARQTCDAASKDANVSVFGRAMHAQCALVYARAIDIRIADIALAERADANSAYVDERNALIAERKRLQAQMDELNAVRHKLDRSVHGETVASQ